MKIRVKADKVRFSLAVPVSMAAWAVKRIPDSVFLAKVRSRIKPPYDQLATKENMALLIDSCSDVLKEHRGLEIVHVETSAGDLVSIIL